MNDSIADQEKWDQYVDSIMDDMKRMRRERNPFSAIIDHFLHQGIDKKVVSACFITAFRFGRAAHLGVRIWSWEESKSSFDTIAENHLVRSQFDDLATVAKVATYYGISEDELRSLLAERNLADEICAYTGWKAGMVELRGEIVKADGVKALDDAVPNLSGQRESYWNWHGHASGRINYASWLFEQMKAAK